MSTRLYIWKSDINSINKGMSSYTLRFSANLSEVSLNLTCSALQ